MENPATPQRAPYKVKVEKGKTYFWCSCGLSAKQPFCDSSHNKEGKLKPFKHVAEESKEIYFCGCKLTQHPPLCDGSHSKP